MILYKKKMIQEIINWCEERIYSTGEVESTAETGWLKVAAYDILLIIDKHAIVTGKDKKKIKKLLSTRKRYY